jgi:small GTP-binding protein
MSAPFDAFNQRRDGVLAVLRQLHTQCERVGTGTLAQRVDSEIVKKLAEDQFHLVVVGEFNHGKTTFVNALLGAQVLPVGVTPTTALIHHVRHAEERSARLVMRGSVDGAAGPAVPTSGHRESERAVSFDELASFTAGHQASADEQVKYLEVSLPSELLRDRITLVDTPGVNDLCLQRADITYKYIPQADAVLFVIDAGQPLKESERVFLKEKLIGQSRDKIIFVVAKADIWSADERAEALGYVRGELAKLIDGPVVFPISAERALAGDRASSGLDELVAHLQAFLAQERGRLMLHNALGDGLAAIKSIGHGLDARRRIAKMSHDEIDRRIARIELDLEGQKRTVDQRRAAIREEVSAVRAWVKRDVDRFADDVLRQLAELIEKAPIEDVRHHLGGFLEATFVQWAEAEAEEVARALEEMAERTVTLMREDAHDAAKRLSAGIGSEVSAPNVSVDTFGYDLGVAALFSVGIGMVFTNLLLGAALTVAAPALAYVLKGRIESETRQKALEQGTLAIRTAANNVAPKLDAMIGEFAERLDKWVETVGSEVHRELLDVLKSAKKQSDSAGADSAKLEQDCQGIASELDRLRAEIERIRAELWAPPTGEAPPVPIRVAVE